MITQSPFAQFLLNRYSIIRWCLVNPHVQRVQNMYGKGGLRVFKVELWAAEVDPLFEICRDLFAVSQKITTFVFLVRLLGNG